MDGSSPFSAEESICNSVLLISKSLVSPTINFNELSVLPAEQGGVLTDDEYLMIKNANCGYYSPEVPVSGPTPGSERGGFIPDNGVPDVPPYIPPVI